MNSRRIILIMFTLLGLIGSTVFAGSFLRVDNQIKSGNVIPFAIVHPFGYTGSGGEIAIDICVLDTFSEAQMLVEPLKSAIDTWNSLVATTGTCQNCLIWEDGPWRTANEECRFGCG